MKKEIRTICYDAELSLEAYRFAGIVQPFPNHFHDYYVIGFVETGKRCLSCKNQTYQIQQGDILLFNPNDNHGCTQQDGGTFAYRGINIPADTMRSLSAEITGTLDLPCFTQTVIADEGLQACLQSLHQMLMTGGERLEKEELLFLLLSTLIERYGQPFPQHDPAGQDAIAAACRFMETHYDTHITLEQLCRCSTLSKSTLLRGFTKSKGVTPYRYLQSIRIGKAKALLENGASPAEAALQTGFADQSHFTNFFHMYIGLSPAAYRRIFRTAREEGENGT